MQLLICLLVLDLINVIYGIYINGEKCLFKLFGQHNRPSESIIKIIVFQGSGSSERQKAETFNRSDRLHENIVSIRTSVVEE